LLRCRTDKFVLLHFFNSLQQVTSILLNHLTALTDNKNSFDIKINLHIICTHIIFALTN